MEFIDIAWYVLVVLLGLAVGSFLNVVIFRLPQKMSINKPKSHCMSCGYELKWYDNIPVLSYLILRGKCRKCKTNISPQYICVELLNMILWLLAYYHFGKTIYTILVMLLISTLIAICFIDYHEYIIPDSLNIVVAILGIAATIFTAITGPVEVEAYLGFQVTYADRLWSLAFFAVMIMLVFIIEKLTKKEIIGGGDIKLIAGIGLFLGWQLAIMGIFIGSIVGVLALPILKKSQKIEGHIIPFGPFLSIGFVLSLFFSVYIIGWYISVLM